MKTLVIYYSLEGNTRFIAETIAKTVSADLLELKPVKDINPKSFMKFFWGGKQVMMKEKPELKPLDRDAGQYDLIFMGTPVWAFTFTPPLRTFFAQAKLNNKKIALFCTNDGNSGKTLINMRNELVDNIILGEKEFVSPLRDEQTSLQGASQWAEEIFNKATRLK